MLFLIVTLTRRAIRPPAAYEARRGNDEIDPPGLAAYPFRATEPVAQPVEQLTFNQ
jgi:hypothetical protein